MINPGIEDGGRIRVIGEHTDGTHAELVAIPRGERLPAARRALLRGGGRLPARVRDRLPDARHEGAAPGRGVGAPLGDRRRRRDRRPPDREGARRARRSSPRRATRSSPGRASSAPTRDQPRDRGRRRARQGDDRRRRDIVVEHVGEATWTRSLNAARVRRPHRRLRRDERARTRPPSCTGSGGSSSRCSARRWAPKTDFEGAYELVASGRALPVVDAVFPLAEARAAHERLEAGEQLGKVVLRIPE